MGLGSSQQVDMSGPVAQLVKELINSDTVVIFSKTYCPYCNMAKEVSLIQKFPFIFIMIGISCCMQASVSSSGIIRIDLNWRTNRLLSKRGNPRNLTQSLHFIQFSLLYYILYYFIAHSQQFCLNWTFNLKIYFIHTN